MTPRMRTVTFGLNCIFSVSGMSSYVCVREISAPLGPRKTEEVEPAHLVRAVVRAVARPDAAVVGHVVQALGAVRRRVDRAHVSRRGLFALHARDGLEGHLRRVRVVADVVAVDADPVHLATAEDLLLADEGDVVLGDAGHDARVAAGACVQIDGHAPLVALVLDGVPERSVLGVGERYFTNSGLSRYSSRVVSMASGRPSIES